MIIQDSLPPLCRNPRRESTLSTLRKSASSNWTVNDIPSQAGTLAVVTGTGGLGYETALALAGAGAEVVIAGRSQAKGQDAVRRIVERHPRAAVRFKTLDLASLDSVAEFSGCLTAEDRPIDLLVNNAGVMATPRRHTTADGFELQFGTNYLGHFALTARLLPLLRRSRVPRVVNLASLVHRWGVIDFDDLQGQHRYRPNAAYAQSKLAMLMFALELQRRSDAAGWNLRSNAAHPGFARTELIANGPGTDSFAVKLSLLLMPLMSHSAADGALPTLFAATAADATGAAYYGPRNRLELKGPPGTAVIGRQARDVAVAARLWERSGELTGAHWPSSK
ncbi:MAG: family NAD(P)-dependent oxidoreductase [Nevskia sp.]|nr:family NAD(P)-dependent oxidoreductase [Nevskia sp.]